MKEFKRNKETGILEVWEDGVKISEIYTMGDFILGNTDNMPKRDTNDSESRKK